MAWDVRVDLDAESPRDMDVIGARGGAIGERQMA